MTKLCTLINLPRKIRCSYNSDFTYNMGDPNYCQISQKGPAKFGSRKASFGSLVTFTFVVATTLKLHFVNCQQWQNKILFIVRLCFKGCSNFGNNYKIWEAINCLNMATLWIHILQHMDNAEFTNICDKHNFATIGKNMIPNVAKTGKKQVYQNLPKLVIGHTWYSGIPLIQIRG